LGVSSTTPRSISFKTFRRTVSRGRLVERARAMRLTGRRRSSGTRVLKLAYCLRVTLFSIKFCVFCVAIARKIIACS